MVLHTGAENKISLSVKTREAVNGAVVVNAENIPNYKVFVRPITKKYPAVIFNKKINKWVTADGLWTDMPVLEKDNKINISVPNTGIDTLSFVLLFPDGQKYFTNGFIVYGSDYPKNYVNNISLSVDAILPPEDKNVPAVTPGESLEYGPADVKVEKNPFNRQLSYAVLYILFSSCAVYLLIIKKTEEVSDDKIHR